ncbi:MAG: GDSL-type esterase/lipase family protein, partial [Pseudomonadota bacterium]
EQAPEFPAESTESTFRILTIGGSTTFGSRLERNETYPAHLQRLLNERWPEFNPVVLNGGVPWHTSMHSLLRYVARYSEWRPNLVIVMHAYNDIAQTSEGKFTTGTYRPDYGHFFGALSTRIRPNDPFFDRLSSAVWGNWVARTWFSDLRGGEPTRALKPVDLLRPLPVYTRNLRELGRRIADDGGRLLIATQIDTYNIMNRPDAPKRRLYEPYYRGFSEIPSIADQRRAMDTFNDAAKDIAKDDPRIGLIDLRANLTPDWENFYDDVHYNADGAKVVAAHIFKLVDWPLHFRQAN